MSIFGKLLKGAASLAADFIPGGTLVKGLVKAAVPTIASAFKKPATKLLAAGVGGYAASQGLAKITSGGQTMMQPIGTLPSLNMASTTASVPSSPGGLPVPWWKGPGGKLQLPWNDPRIPEYLKQFALDDAYLKVYYRAPKGYVIVKDVNGKAYAVNKQVAKMFGLWKPAAKPPISATDWKHFKRNKTIEKRLKKIAGPTLRKTTSRRCTTTKKR